MKAKQAGFIKIKNYFDKGEQENQKLKKQYCERTDCSGRIGNSKKVEELEKRLKASEKARKEAIDYIEKFVQIDVDTILMREKQRDYLIEILDIDKGE